MRRADLDLLRAGNGLGGGVLTSEGVFRIMMQGSQGMVHTRRGWVGGGLSTRAWDASRRTEIYTCALGGRTFLEGRGVQPGPVG